MVYTTISSQEVIARVLRNTKMIDLTYADDILVWLREAVRDIKTRGQVKPLYSKYNVRDYAFKLPCGLQAIDGIVYNNCRLPYGLGVTDSRVMPINLSDPNVLSTYFSDTTDPAYYSGQEIDLLRGDDIKFEAQTSTSDYYIPYPDYIQTSFKEGVVILFWRKLPVDEKGYPLIADSEDHIMACFWYIMAMLALSGYKHNDPKMDYDYCDNKYTEKRIAAINKARAWSTDKKQAFLNMTVNLIPPRDYYNLFFVNAEAPR